MRVASCLVAALAASTACSRPAGVRAFGFGPAGFAGIRELQRAGLNDSYSERRGWGFTDAAELEASADDRWGVWPDPVAASWIAGRGEFAVSVKPGEYIVALLIRDIPRGSVTAYRASAYVNGVPFYNVDVAKGAFLQRYTYRLYPRGEVGYDPDVDLWDSHVEPEYPLVRKTVDAPAGRLTLRLDGAAVCAMIAFPKGAESSGEAFINDLQLRRRSLFPYRLVEGRERRISRPPQGDGYIVFVPEDIEGLRPDTEPPPLGEKPAIRITAARGETEPAFVAVTALEDLRRVTVRATDLSGPEGAVVPAGAMDVRLVYYTPKRTSAYSRSFDFYPRLLIKAESAFVRKGVTQGWWIDLAVPQHAVPGEYKGELIISADGMDERAVPMTATVLPFELSPLCNYRQALYHFYHKVNEEYGLAREAVRDLVAHGMNTPCFDTRVGVSWAADGGLACDFRRLVADAAAYAEGGMPMDPSGVMILQDPLRDIYRLVGEDYGSVGSHQVKESFSPDFDRALASGCRKIVDLCRKMNWPTPYIYMAGESSSEGEAGVRTAAHLLSVAKGAGIRTHTTLNGESGWALLPYLDSAAANDNMRLGVAVAERFAEAGVEYWLYIAKGEPERFMRGWYLWASGAEGVSKEGYIVRDSDQFNEFSPARAWWEIWWEVRPSPDGLVPSVEWQMAREGVDDARYIQTLADLIEQAEQAGATEAAGRARATLDGLISSVGTELAAHRRVGFWKPAEYNSRRRRLVEAIGLLLDAVEGAPAPAGGTLKPHQASADNSLEVVCSRSEPAVPVERGHDGLLQRGHPGY